MYFGFESILCFCARKNKNHDNFEPWVSSGGEGATFGSLSSLNLFFEIHFSIKEKKEKKRNERFMFLWRKLSIFFAGRIFRWIKYSGLQSIVYILLIFATITSAKAKPCLQIMMRFLSCIFTKQLASFV